MSAYKKQGELFSREISLRNSSRLNKDFFVNQKFLETWQTRIYAYQEQHFKSLNPENSQISLFKEDPKKLKNLFDPLKLTPLPLNFWRSSKPYHYGPAIYLVMDRIHGNKNLILYIGETIAAEQRWKGDHDCKSYLDNYSIALQQAGMSSELSIRFWVDVPKETSKRRKLEKELITQWLPPFNKETRARWQTPFTAEIN